MPVLTGNHQPLSITAKVDAVINVTDFLDWTHDFMPALDSRYSSESSLPFEGTHPQCSYGDQYLSSGLWRFTVTEGTCDADHPIEITVNLDQPNAYVVSLTALNTPVEITIPPDTETYIRLYQNGMTAAATVIMTHAAQFDSNGDLPNIIVSGDTLTAQFPYTPRLGVLTATAHIYDGNGLLIASSDEITLTITDSSSGGGS